MRPGTSLLVAAIALSACGDNTPPPGPFDSLPSTGDFKAAGLTAPVHVARDKFGIAHISGDTIGDVGYAEGYVMAHDRLPQMDILRRFGAGTLSELFGALDSSVIDTDLEMRVHRMKPLAQQTWDMLNASTDPSDVEVVQLLQRFTDGVNAYAADLNAHKWSLDTNVEISFDPTRFVAWTPVDSLILGRFQSFALSWSTPFETDLTELYQGLRTQFDAAAPADAAAYARRGISVDFAVVQPVRQRSTIDGFPNVTTDTGTRSDAGRPGHAKGRHPRAGHALPAPPNANASTSNGPRRPVVPKAVFDAARKFLATNIRDGVGGAYGPHAFMRPWAGSNNWAVSPALAGGNVLLGSDQHLQLPNPSIFYPVHLIVKGQLDAMGVTFPGIPGIILGTNGNLAWAATVSEHDVNDVYLENIHPCAAGGGNCVTFQGAEVAMTTFTETIQIGALGTITSSVDATYEVVPHHGPLIPTIANHKLVPRATSQGMSVRYTGYEPTFEVRAIYDLAHATTVDAGFKALANFSYGSQNWTMIDNSGSIGWTTNAIVPWRDPNAYTWDPITNPDGLAPFLVLPADGSAEWQGRMDSRYVPHAIDPAKGYLATANADPVGATFDNNALNQPMVDGRPLYVGVTYTAGYREDRISTLIERGAAAAPLTTDDIATIQHDTHSNVGESLVPSILAALAYTADATGAPPDVAPYLAGLSAADAQRLATAKQLIASWTFATPTATAGAPSAQDLTDSAATALFNAWMHYIIQRTLADELNAFGYDVWRLDDNFSVRIIYHMLTAGSSRIRRIRSRSVSR